MALQIPTYPSPFGPDLTDAYAWFAAMILDFRGSSETYSLAIHPNVESAYAGKPPMLTRHYVGGRDGFPTLAEMVNADPLLAQAFGYIRLKLYEVAVQADPLLANAKDVP